MATRALKTVEQTLDEIDSKRNIAQRIAAVMGEVDYVQKEKKQGMSYTVVSHDKVTALVRPALHKHGVICYPRDLNVTQNGNRTEAVFTVRFENIDDRTDYIDVATFGYGVDNQDKGPGKAISYGVKYAYLKCLGLETGDDPDEVQDDRANYQPARPTTGEQRPGNGPVPRTKLEGQWTSKTALRNAVNAIANAVRKADSNETITSILKTDANRKTIEQAERDWPELITGDPRIEGDGGLKGYVKRCRETLNGSLTYQLLMSTLSECETEANLRDWNKRNADRIGELDGEESRKFEAFYDEKAASIKENA